MPSFASLDRAFQAQWSLYVPSRLTLTNSTFCPQMYLCVLCGSENKQQLFPCITLTDWFVQPRRGVFTARYGLGLIYIIHINLAPHSLFLYLLFLELTALIGL